MIRRLSAMCLAALLIAGATAISGCADDTSDTADQPPLPAAYPTSVGTTAQADADRSRTSQDEASDAGEAASDAPATTTRTDSTSREILSSADRRSFAALEQSIGSPIGVAVSGLGSGQPVQSAGSLRSVVAWSTSKVPVAMAAEAAGLADAHGADLRQAITASDNAAAERLWAALGDGQTAAAAADAQLRAAGDTHTTVQSQRLRSGFTPFGQTSWTLTDQARFTAGMACSDAGLAVLDLMRQTIPAQRWGLGAAAPDAAIKGGWGPGQAPGVGGGYLDRQMGIIAIHGTPLAVAIAALPSDGQHSTGTAQLTRIARWVLDHANVENLSSRARCGR